MEHSIEVEGHGSVAVREPRRDLQTRSRIGASDDGLSPGQLKAFEERRRHDPHLELRDERRVRPAFMRTQGRDDSGCSLC